MKNEKPNNNDPAGNLLYITSDQLVFFDRGSAMRHSRVLGDATIVTMTQREADAQLEALDKNAGQDELETLLDELTGVE